MRPKRSPDIPHAGFPGSLVGCLLPTFQGLPCPTYVLCSRFADVRCEGTGKCTPPPTSGSGGPRISRKLLGFLTWGLAVPLEQDAVFSLPIPHPPPHPTLVLLMLILGNEQKHFLSLLKFLVCYYFSLIGLPLTIRHVQPRFWIFEWPKAILAQKTPNAQTRAAAAAAAAKSSQSCPTLCDPKDGSSPGSPVPGILQARTLEWAAMSFSNA